MKIIGIDIGTTTISGVVLENKVEGQITTKAEEKLEIVEAKTIENGCFIPTEHAVVIQIGQCREDKQ